MRNIKVKGIQSGLLSAIIDSVNENGSGEITISVPDDVAEPYIKAITREEGTFNI